MLPPASRGHLVADLCAICAFDKTGELLWKTSTTWVDDSAKHVAKFVPPLVDHEGEISAAAGALFAESQNQAPRLVEAAGFEARFYRVNEAGIAVFAATEEDEHLRDSLIELRRLSIRGRIAPGISHRINNISTALLIVRQLLEPNQQDDDYSDVTQIVDQSVRRLGLLAELFSPTAQPDSCDAKHVVEICSDALSGFDHRVGITVKADQVKGVAVGQWETVDMVLLAGLLLHAFVPSGGAVVFEVAEDVPLRVAVSPNRGQELLDFESLPRDALEDLALLYRMTAEAGGGLEISHQDHQLILSLALPPLT